MGDFLKIYFVLSTNLRDFPDLQATDSWIDCRLLIHSFIHSTLTECILFGLILRNTKICKTLKARLRQPERQTLKRLYFN